MNISQPTKAYYSNHSIVYSCQYHVIWCTKFRRPVLSDEMQTRLKELALEKQDEYGYQVHEAEVMADHVHLLLSINPQHAPSKVVGRIKGYTSHRLRTEFSALKTRLPSLWTRSKFISSVGSVTLEVVKQYIENQKGR